MQVPGPVRRVCRHIQDNTAHIYGDLASTRIDRKSPITSTIYSLLCKLQDICFGLVRSLFTDLTNAAYCTAPDSWEQFTMAHHTMFGVLSQSFSSSQVSIIMTLHNFTFTLIYSVQALDKAACWG